VVFRGHSSTFRRRGGFTLVELGVVLGIVGVITALSVSSLRPLLPRFRLVSAANKLKGDLVSVKSLALASGRQTRLRLVAPTGGCADTNQYGGGWVMEIGDRSRSSVRWQALPVPGFSDGLSGSVDLGPGGNAQARDVCLDSWGTLGAGVPADADAVVFNPRGFLDNSPEDLPTGYIQIPLLNQAARAEGQEDQLVVLISAAGAVRIVNPGAST
jgi:Tfp pilus assembly protein FimT